MENIGNPPRDVVTEILLSLPAKSLMRFKCVCKSWQALISSPQFITMHLNHNKNNTCLLVKHCLSVGATRKKQNVLSLISVLDNDFSSIARVNVEPIVELVGHHNGIICLSYCWDYVVLCNPGMKEFRVLPRSCIPIPSDPNVTWCTTKFVGFGYDSQTNDYKVVRMLDNWHSLVSPVVEVYTMSTDSWREIKVDQLIGAPVINSQMHFNGVCYWWAQIDVNIEVILTFDMANEVFQKIPTPKYYWCYRRSLMMFNESIALIYYRSKEDQQSFDFWVMDEFGMKGPWKKLFSVGPMPWIEMPLVFWKNNELLMEGKDGQVITYNLKTQEIRNLPIYGIPKNLAAAIYVNSLVSIKPS